MPLRRSPAYSELSACCPGVHKVTPSLCMCPWSTKMRHVCCVFLVQNLLSFLKSFISSPKENVPHAPSPPALSVCESHVGSQAPLLPWAPEPTLGGVQVLEQEQVVWVVSFCCCLYQRDES